MKMCYYLPLSKKVWVCKGGNGNAMFREAKRPDIITKEAD